MNGSFRAGFVANLPIAASVGAYGSILGVLAAQKGITWPMLLLMNVSIFAGSAQFVIVDMWLPPLPVFEIGIAVLAINLRYLLIGASLQPLFAGNPIHRKLLIMHLVADENWAVTMSAHRKGLASTDYLLGGGICLFSVWSMSTLFGHGLGAAVTHPEIYGLDFAFIAVFTALAVSLLRGKEDLLPWMIAAGTAILTEQFIPGKWYIVIGGITGALASVFMPETEGEN